MMDLMNPKWETFECIDMPKRERKPGQKVRCTFYKIKPGSYKPERREHQITDMPKELYEAFFQARVA